MAEWLCIIRPRETFLDDATSEESAVMREHFEYLSGLLEQGKLVLAGPKVSKPPFGVIVLEAETEDDAWALVRADPSVRSGLQQPEVHPFRVSLLRGRG